MKQIFLISLLIAMLLPLTISCGKDEAEQPSEQKNNQDGQGGQDDQGDSTAPIIVTVDENGNADGGHHFVNIDGESFYIDKIKYSVTDGNLIVTGYDKDTFAGRAKIISQLNYAGHELHVIEIGEYAFGECTVLTSVTIPSSVIHIGYGAFEGCTSLTSVTINSNSIAAMNYSNSPNLREIFGKQVKSYIIGEGVTKIGEWAFAYYTGLTSVTLPEGVNSIGRYAFFKCTGLTSVMTPSSVTNIGESAFDGCTGLTYVTIPEGVTSIGKSAFQDCKGLRSVAIPSSITSIGNSAFYGCMGLTSVHITNLEAWCKIAFEENPLHYAHHLYLNGQEIKDLVIPSSVTSIGMYSFDGCSGLTSATIPMGITSIGKNAFADCTGLTSVTIPEGVNSIGEMAFYGCTGLTSVTIPSSVTSIEDLVFYNSKGLTNVYCYAEKVPNTGSGAFDNSTIANGTLHVPSSVIYTYRKKSPWSGFRTIVAIQ